jgi:hypothetical protein
MLSQPILSDFSSFEVVVRVSPTGRPCDMNDVYSAGNAFCLLLGETRSSLVCAYLQAG